MRPTASVKLLHRAGVKESWLPDKQRLIGFKHGSGTKQREAKRQGRRFWESCRAVMTPERWVRRKMFGTYTRETPREVKGRGAAKRRAKKEANQ